MKFAVRKRNPILLAALIVVGNLFLFLLPMPLTNEVKPVKPKVDLASIFVTDSILIGLGVAVQMWTRDKPRYKLLGLAAYVCTMLVFTLLSAILIAALMGRFS